jgi:hypothetical protein
LNSFSALTSEKSPHERPSFFLIPLLLLQSDASSVLTVAPFEDNHKPLRVALLLL